LTACVICGEQDSRVLYRGTDRFYGTTTEIFSVVECRNCGMARLDPRPADLARYYPPLYWFSGGPANIYRRLVVRHHVCFVRQALGTGTRVLDAGSGGGLLAAQLRRGGVHAFALDIAPAAVRLAARDGVPSLAADFADPPFAGSSFDVIALFHVLEHVSDPRHHLQTAHRLLAPHGRLVIAVPNFDSLQRRIFGTRWNGLDIPRHLHHFRARDLLALLEQTGFHVTRTRHFSWRDSPAGLATTLAPGLDPMSRLIRRRGGSNAAYTLLTALSLPFVAVEAATKHGSAIMMQAARL
jgi:SAM-dependent methyltransferase